MELNKYKHIKDNIHLLEINVEEGLVLNKKTSKHGNGYLTVNLAGKNVKIHQLVAFRLYGEKCIGLDVNHRNGRKDDNRACNIELTTRSENIIHAVMTGLKKSKLTKDDVLVIRERLASGDKVKDIANDYSVAHQTISDIKVGRTWSHITIDDKAV